MDKVSPVAAQFAFIDSIIVNVYFSQTRLFFFRDLIYIYAFTTLIMYGIFIGGSHAFKGELITELLVMGLCLVDSHTKELYFR